MNGFGRDITHKKRTIGALKNYCQVLQKRGKSFLRIESK